MRIWKEYQRYVQSHQHRSLHCVELSSHVIGVLSCVDLVGSGLPWYDWKKSDVAMVDWQLCPLRHLVLER